MELFVVYSTFRSLTILLKSYSDINLLNIYAFVNTQVVLPWLLTVKIKAKSLFTRNRLKDIPERKEQLSKGFAVYLHYKYVHIVDNPIDLGIQSDKVVLEWKGKVNLFIIKERGFYFKRYTIRQTRNSGARY